MSRFHARSIVYSLLLHASCATLLLANFEYSMTPNVTPAARVNLIEAVTVDAAQVAAELERLREIDQRKQREETELERQIQQLKADATRAEQRRKKEEQRAQKAKQQAAAKERQRQAEQEKLDQLRKEQAAERKRQQEQRRKAAAEKARQAAAEKARQAAAEKAREEEERKRKLAEQSLREQVAEEQRLLETAEANRRQRIIGQYVARITDAVQREFNTVGLPSGLSCVLHIRMIPGGDVIDARVIRSSGNAVFDRRAEIAVGKAAPLPVPDERAVFDKMREIRITFAPQD